MTGEKRHIRDSTTTGIDMKDIYNTRTSLLIQQSSTATNPLQRPSTSSNANHPDTDTAETPIIFDSILSSFNPVVFLHQLCVHLLPFGFLLSPNMIAQGFRGGNYYDTLFNIAQYFVFYIMLFCYPYSGLSKSAYLNGSMWIAVVYYIEHKIMVSVKYACLSTSEYHRIMSCTDPVTANIYQGQMNIIPGWLERDDHVLQFELNASAVRIGINMSHVFFSIPNPTYEEPQEHSHTASAHVNTTKKASQMNQFHYWNAFLRGQTIIDTATLPPKEMSLTENQDEYVVSVFDFCLALIRRSDEIVYYNIRVKRGILLHLVWIILIPVILLCIYRDSVDFSATLVLYVIFVSGMTVTFGFIVQQILYTSLFDVLRQLHMMRDLTRCMRLSDLELPADHGGMVSVNFSRQQQIEVSARNRLAIQQLHQQGYSPLNTSSNIKRRSGRMMKIDPKITRTSTSSSDGGNGSKDIDDKQEEEEEASLLDHIGERQAKDNSLAIIPRLSFHDVRNITSWTYARLILQNFGERYRIRMDLYIGGTIIMFVILAIVVFVRIYFTQNRIKGIVSAFILQVLLSITAISLLVLSILYTSALVNAEMEQHKQLLNRHILLTKHVKQNTQAILNQMEEDENIEEEVIENQRKALENYEEILEQLETSIDVLEAENEQKPFCIFGIPADMSLVMAGLSAILSFYGSILSLYAADNPLLGEVGAEL